MNFRHLFCNNNKFISQVLRRTYKTSVNSVKVGQVIEINGKASIFLGKEVGGTGRGGSVLKISLKDPVTGGKSNLRVHGNDPVEVLLLRQIEYQYLYSFENKVNLMNMSTFEELSLSQDMIEGGKNNLNLLTDGMPITVQSLEPEPGPISFRLPARYKYKIEKINRRTAQDKGTTYNPAFINDGKVEVKVPEFIDEGEEVIIDLATKEYVSRD